MSKNKDGVIIMGTLSKMAEKCKICPDRDKCGHTCMEMCAYLDNPKEMSMAVGNICGVINITSDISKEIADSIKKRHYMDCGW